MSLSLSPAVGGGGGELFTSGTAEVPMTHEGHPCYLI